MNYATGRVRHIVKLCLLISGISGLLVLPGLPFAFATKPALAGGQDPSSYGLDADRKAALEKLFAELEAGGAFSEEEAIILRRFESGAEISELEADTCISRALYDFYIDHKELTREQQELLARYARMVARRSNDVADLKTYLLDRRKAAAALRPVRATPLVPPSNDLCAGAEVIPPAGPFPHLTAVTADITDATTTGDPPLPSCQTNVSRSIWYRFTPTTTATYTITTCSFDGTATTVDDTVMAIYTSSTGACGGVFTEIPTTATTDGCGDDECVEEALQAVIRTQLNAGTTYFFVVWEFDPVAPTSGNTAVQLRVMQELPPVNDTCAGAATLALDTPVNGSTRFGNDNYRLSGSACFTGLNQTASVAGGRDVVYTFGAPLPGAYSIRVSDYDEAALSNLVLYTASSCPAAGASPTTVATCLAAANRSSDGTAEQVLCQTLAVNQQIYIFVDEDALTDGGTFTIEVTRCVGESEANDTPATADPLAFGLEGSINPGADADFFSLGTFAAGSRVFAMVEGAASLSSDFDLRVTTATDTLEYDDQGNDAPFGFNAPNVTGTILSASPAFLRVNHFSAQASEPYRVYSVVQPPIGSATAETEPNDMIGIANSAANNYFTGTLAGPAPSTDVDIFSFSAVAGDIIFLGLDGDPLRDNTPINASLELLDSNGVQLVLVNDGGMTSDISSGAGSLTATTPFSPGEALVFRARTTGTYFARVTIGTNSNGPIGAGDYLLSISRNGRPGSCTFTVSPLLQSFSAMAGNGMINVSAGAGCDWTAVSNDGFITITSGSAGTGNGTVNYSVTANPGPGIRSGAITVAGKTFIVRQGIDFLDVPQSHVFYTEIGKLSARGVTLGCDASNYCPDLVVTRDQMAAFILRARGEFNPPTPPTQRFADTPPTNVFYPFIDRMAVLQITLGCDVGLYCPADPVLRDQMAAFIIRALGEFNPPEPAMQRFLDVPPTNPFYRFIDRMAVLQITLGCGGGNYCPSLAVSRAQMAAFLVRAFNL